MKKVYTVWITIDVTLPWITLAFARIFIKAQKSEIVSPLGEPFRVNIMKDRFNIKLGRKSMWKGVID